MMMSQSQGCDNYCFMITITGTFQKPISITILINFTQLQLHCMITTTHNTDTCSVSLGVLEVNVIHGLVGWRYI